MDLFNQLLDLLQSSEGTPAVSSFIPEDGGEEDRISYFVTGYRLDTLPGQVVLVSRRGSVWSVSEARWQADFKRADDLRKSVVTPA